MQTAREEREALARQALDEKEKADARLEKAERLVQEAKEKQNQAELDLQQGKPPLILPTVDDIKAMKQKYRYIEGFFHFAIAGISGSGKSSLINAFRGVTGKDSRVPFAAVNVVETTTEVGRYPDPDPKKPFIWYDAPGAGTWDINDWTYFTDQGLYIFDCILVVWSTRFTKTDLMILEKCQRFGIPAYIVRSKSDEQIRNLQKTKMVGDEDSDEEDDTDDDTDRARARASRHFAEARDQYISATRQNVEWNLREAGLLETLKNPYVYIISHETLLAVIRGKSLKKKLVIDEPNLVETLLQDAFDRRCVVPREAGQVAPQIPEVLV